MKNSLEEMKMKKMKVKYKYQSDRRNGGEDIMKAWKYNRSEKLANQNGIEMKIMAKSVKIWRSNRNNEIWKWKCQSMKWRKSKEKHQAK